MIDKVRPLAAATHCAQRFRRVSGRNNDFQARQRLYGNVYSGADNVTGEKHAKKGAEKWENTQLIAEPASKGRQRDSSWHCGALQQKLPV